MEGKNDEEWSFHYVKTTDTIGAPLESYIEKYVQIKLVV